jgi:hypothetical protein
MATRKVTKGAYATRTSDGITIHVDTDNGETTLTITPAQARAIRNDLTDMALTLDD